MEFARRCTTCGISYPDTYNFQKCPLHDEPTDRIQDSHDEDWAARLHFLKVQLDLAEMDAELIHLVEGKVTLADGVYWLSSHDVIRSGVRHRLEPDALVKVGQQVFEIQAYSYARRAYIVEPFSMALTDDEIAELLRGA